MTDSSRPALIHYQSLTIEKLISETPDFKTFVLSSATPIIYEAGQFLTLVHQQHGTALRRSYSIVSSPALGEPLSIGVKRIANGLFSRKLVDEAKPGDRLLTTGAGGFFKLPATPGRYDAIFLFAAGSGITPVFSILKTALHTHPGLRLVLVYSNQSPATAAYLEPLRTLADEYRERFSLELLFSSSPHLSTARLTRDMLLDLLARYRVSVPQTLFYTCGPATYMRMISYTLQERGVPAAHIRKEDFAPASSALPKAAPPDTASHEVLLHVGDNDHRFVVHFPDTILQAAKKQGLVLPYSCETGKCGSCAATCLRGKVWLAMNEVLTDEDIAKGLTLTCVGHPIDGDLELRIL